MPRISSFFLFLCLFALPLSAQDDALTGTWETSFTDPEVGDITISLTFEAGGGFQLDQVIEASDSFLAEAGDAVAIEEFTAHGTGTYRVEGDSLFADLTELNMYVDGRDFVEVLTEVARALARIAADFGGISDEDYPAFEEAAVDELLAGFDEEQFLGGFAGGEFGTYAIEGDTLSITTTVEGEVDTLDFMRIDTASAVAPTTWGSLKADMRP